MLCPLLLYSYIVGVCIDFKMKFVYMCASQVGERIRVILDCDDNTLAFEKNYEFLGNICCDFYDILIMIVYLYP